ncbi:MAG: type IV pilin protein [Thiogranum sp.]|nr:type IV pilin protein [Thiogranum sp.]
MKLKKHNGFTLIEVMIVVAIVGILAAIAYPSYQEQVRKSRRADCAGELTLLANAMERFFTLNGAYPATLAAANFPAQCPIDGGTPSYDFAIALDNPGPGFTVTAAPIGPQASDKCGTLGLTHLGAQTVSTGLPLTECW